VKEVELLPDCQCHPVCDWHYKLSKSTGKLHHWFRCFHRNPHPPLNCEKNKPRQNNSLCHKFSFISIQITHLASNGLLKIWDISR